MKSFAVAMVALAVPRLLIPGINNTCAAQQSTAQNPSDRVVAIDVLLEPDAVMVKRAIESNAKLRENYPQGYTLGPEQVPHITLVQRYVKAKDLEAVGAAVSNALAKEDPRTLQLSATGYAYAPWAGVAITSIAVERTPQLSRLQENIVKAVEPFAVSTGTAAAFSTSNELPKIESAIVDYVKTFVPKSSGDKYNPHVTIGVAHEDFVKQLKAEPFPKFTFKPAGVAAYQLGAYGTAQKKLWQWKPSTNKTPK